MNARQKLLPLFLIVLIVGCASGISKKVRIGLQNEAIDVLNNAVLLDDYFVRSKAIDAMRDSEDQSFVPALLDALYDYDDIIVMKASRALGALGDTVAIPDLEFTLAFDDNFTAQKASAVALYRLGKKDEALEFIKNALKNESSYNKGLMINELTFARSDDFIPMYIEMLDDPAESVKDDAINALSLREATQAIPNLMKTLTDSFLLVRADAIITIAQLGDTTQIREAMNITQKEIDRINNGELDLIVEFDEYKFNAYKILLASTLLTELDDTTHIGYLYELSREPMNPMSILATIMLADWGDTNAIEKVNGFLDMDEVNIRKSVVQIVGDIDKDWACKFLIKATKDPDIEVRETATRFLRFYDKKEVKEILTALLNDPSPEVQIEAALTLNDLGDKKGVFVLHPLLRSDDWYIKVEAAQAILTILKTT